MAIEVLEMATAHKGKLDGGLSSSVSKASQELNGPNVIKDQQAHENRLAISQKTGNVSDEERSNCSRAKLNLCYNAVTV